MDIRVENLNKRFRQLRVLNSISLAMESNRCIAMIGPNGSGKTTFIKCLLGLVILDSGTISIKGKSIGKDFSYRSQIGYMPQIGRFPENISIAQLFNMIKEVRRYDSLDEELFERFQLKAIYHKKIRTLSGGTRQKVSASLAFLFNPDIIILDEPTAGLDPVSSEILKDKILSEQNKNKLILITSHIMNDLDELCTDAFFMLEGKIKFMRSIAELKRETGEERLGKAIAALLNDYSG